MTSIRTAIIADLPRLENLAREFYSASKHLKVFELPRFIDLWTALLTAKTGAIFLLEEDSEIAGTIGGILYPDTYSASLVATEMFWFVADGKRGGGMRLYYAFEKWAREAGADTMHMVHLLDSMPDRLANVYTRLGYTAVETRYSKEL